MTRTSIRTCVAWEDRHDRPVYTLGEHCPDCGAETVPCAPTPFDPTDRHGRHRRSFKRRSR